MQYFAKQLRYTSSTRRHSAVILYIIYLCDELGNFIARTAIEQQKSATKKKLRPKHCRRYLLPMQKCD